jgi:hypothetical protein
MTSVIKLLETVMINLNQFKLIDLNISRYILQFKITEVNNL